MRTAPLPALSPAPARAIARLGCATTHVGAVDARDIARRAAARDGRGALVRPGMVVVAHVVAVIARDDAARAHVVSTVRALRPGGAAAPARGTPAGILPGHLGTRRSRHLLPLGQKPRGGVVIVGSPSPLVAGPAGAAARVLVVLPARRPPRRRVVAARLLVLTVAAAPVGRGRRGARPCHGHRATRARVRNRGKSAHVAGRASGGGEKALVLHVGLGPRALGVHHVVARDEAARLGVSRTASKLMGRGAVDVVVELFLEEVDYLS